MTYIKPANEEERYKMLGRLAEAVGRHLGFPMKPYSASAIADRSGDDHWMYNFTEHESRIYHIKDGMQRLVDIEVAKLIDLDAIDKQIQKAILELNEISLRN
jgi:hypothetical protein